MEKAPSATDEEHGKLRAAKSFLPKRLVEKGWTNMEMSKEGELIFSKAQAKPEASLKANGKGKDAHHLHRFRVQESHGKLVCRGKTAKKEVIAATRGEKGHKIAVFNGEGKKQTVEHNKRAWVITYACKEQMDSHAQHRFRSHDAYVLPPHPAVAWVLVQPNIYVPPPVATYKYFAIIDQCTYAVCTAVDYMGRCTAGHQIVSQCPY